MSDDMRRLGGCLRAVIVLGLPDRHCTSCHEDADMGYEMCEIETRAGWYEACCVVAGAYEDRKTQREGEDER